MSLDDLAPKAAACRRCPGVVPGSAVVDALPGSSRPHVLFVGEAPGRLGAARTGLPLYGDIAGERFARLLGEARLERAQVAVTNAVLCLPLDQQGNNRRPAGGEVSACSGFLAAAIGATRPGMVVALGRVALAALGHIEPHGLTLRTAVGRLVPWRGAVLTALYHPAARSAAHRPWGQQVLDWRRLGDIVSKGEIPENADTVTKRP
jgi:uracil-DNA glycosylase family 4